MEWHERITAHAASSFHNLRYTLRGLRRDPVFATVSILILALAIGANIAVFAKAATRSMKNRRGETA